MIFDVCDWEEVPKNSPIHRIFFHEKKQKKRTTQKTFFSSFWFTTCKTHVSRTLSCGYKNNASQKTTTQNTHASLLLYILKMALTIMASLAKVRRLFLLLLLLLLLTLLLSRRVLKRTHHGRRRRRRNNGRRRNGRRKKITRVVVV